MGGWVHSPLDLFYSRGKVYFSAFLGVAVWLKGNLLVVWGPKRKGHLSQDQDGQSTVPSNHDSGATATTWCVLAGFAMFRLCFPCMLGGLKFESKTWAGGKGPHQQAPCEETQLLTDDWTLRRCRCKMNWSDVVRGEGLVAASVFALPRNPADRMTLEEVLSHPWIALNCTGSLAESLLFRASRAFQLCIPPRRECN